MFNTDCTCCDCEGCFPINLNSCPWCNGKCIKTERIETFCRNTTCEYNSFGYCESVNRVCKDRNNQDSSY